MHWPQTLLITNVVTTLFMVGLIWMVQIVHYPLFDNIGDQNYVQYHQRHQANISLIVGPVMLIELASAIFMAWYPAPGIDQRLVYLGIGLVVAIWISTAELQIPCHEKLVRGFDQSAYDFLVQSNWIRTLAWSARGVLVTWMLVCILPK